MTATARAPERLGSIVRYAVSHPAGTGDGRPMRVLLLPLNIASQVSTMVRALREIGVDARGIVLENNPIQGAQGIECFPSLEEGTLIERWRKHIAWWGTFLRAVLWADVIHWHYGISVLPANLDLRSIALLGRARIVQFWGSDIRDPEKAIADNPYLTPIYGERRARAAGRRSRATQARFARYGFECAVAGFEMIRYIHRDLFPHPHRSKSWIHLPDFEPKYPDARVACPAVAHAPSRKRIKGTEHVLRAVEPLVAKGRCTFKLIHGMPHEQAIAAVRECDIFLDQFIIGAHGLASLEAMALGKPAICYIKPSLLPEYPPDCPIVPADPDHLAEVLGALLSDGPRRAELGRRGRAYIEAHHDARARAAETLGLYRELLARQRRGRR